MGICCCKSKPNIEDIKLEQLKESKYETTDDPTYDFNKAKVIKVYDGDTITIAAFYGEQICRFSVRLYGIDCDEIKGGTSVTKHNALLAKAFVENMLLNKIVNINVLNNKKVNNRKVKEKYGRLLAIVSIDGKNVSEELLKAGLARPYFGGHKDDTPLHPRSDIQI